LGFDDVVEIKVGDVEGHFLTDGFLGEEHLGRIHFFEDFVVGVVVPDSATKTEKVLANFI
jgi:hypothetical protein